MWHALVLAPDTQQRDHLRSIVATLHRGLTVHTEQSVTKAQDLVKQMHFGLVIVSMGEEFKRNLEFLRWFRATKGCHDTPVVSLVPADLALMRLQVLKCGATDILVTPQDLATCAARLGNLFKLHRYRKMAEFLSRRSQRSGPEREAVFSEGLAIGMLEKLGAARNKKTFIHEIRTGRLARLIAEGLALDHEESSLIGRGATLHDIGKMGVPDEVLNKPGGFTDAERLMVCEHPQIGRDILTQGDSPVLSMASQIAYSHHERVDGTGYPQGLRGRQIPLAARIVAVADVFDSVTEPRPYKQPWSVERAFEYLKSHRGSLFDRSCVAALWQQRDAAMAVISAPVSA
jgi:HD-GYP domain-containing protein (c-di-GMP phosphodiesterase class II)